MAGPRPFPATETGAQDPLQQIIDRQVEVMRKQLELLRAAEAAGGADSGGANDERSRALSRLREAGPTGAASANGRDRASGVAEGHPANGRSRGGSADAIDPTALEAFVDRVALSDAQRDVWVVCQLGAEASAAYNLSTALELRGGLDVGALHEALRRTVARHDALRSTIDATGDHMVVLPFVDVSMPLVDLSDRSEAEREAEILAILDAELTVPYDLVAGPLFRFTLVRLSAADHLLVLSAQHLICDGWSFGVMHRDIGVLYSQLTHGAPGPAADVIQLREYVAWGADQAESSERYWLDLYRDPPAQLDLPVDAVRPPVRTFAYDSERVVLDGELLASVRALATDTGVTPFGVLLTAWQILLSRLSGQTEFASGVFVSGQASMGARDLVGLCANLLPLRSRIAPEEPLSDLLMRLRREHIRRLRQPALSARQARVRVCSSHVIPAARRWSRRSSRWRRHRPASCSRAWTSGRPSTGGGPTASSTSRLYLTETADDVKVDLQYSTGLFEPGTIRRWIRHYVHLLGQMTSGAASPVGDLGLLDPDERQELLTRWNATEAPIPDAATHRRFEAIAAGSPERTAVRTSARHAVVRGAERTGEPARPPPARPGDRARIGSSGSMSTARRTCSWRCWRPTRRAARMSRSTRCSRASDSR